MHLHALVDSADDDVFPHLRALSSLGLQHALAPLLARTRIIPVAASGARFVCCEVAGALAVSSDLPVDRAGLIALRQGLDLAWLIGLPGLAPAAAAILAARVAAGFAQLLPPDGLSPPWLALVSGDFDPTRLREAAVLLADTHIGLAALEDADLVRLRALWPLAEPSEQLLTQGGDDRLTLDPVTGRNKYGCTPWPRPSVITFASCTASSLPTGAFAAAEQARRTLMARAHESSVFTSMAEASAEIERALLRYFDIEELADVILAASGTDAALLVTGLLAAEQPGSPLTSILMSPAETGSGVPDAVQGRHFAPQTAAGWQVGKGEPIEGLSAAPLLATIAIRDAAGLPRAMGDIDADCAAAIESGLSHGRVVLHAIDGSKTGLTAPSREACGALARRHGGSLDIVIDACQARIEPALARWYLAQGFPVLVTGSKFFAAPGFCGAVLFPRARLQRIARQGGLPAGLAAYTRLSSTTVSRRCPGLILRWRAALHEMTAFSRLATAEVARRLDRLGSQVQQALSCEGAARLIEAPRPEGMGWSDRRSVFTFMLRGQQGWLAPPALRALYVALSDEGAQIGQPVQLGHPGLGGLRLAISARQVMEPDRVAGDLAAVMGRLAEQRKEGLLF